MAISTRQLKQEVNATLSAHGMFLRLAFGEGKLTREETQEMEQHFEHILRVMAEKVCEFYNTIVDFSRFSAHEYLTDFERDFAC